MCWPGNFWTVSRGQVLVVFRLYLEATHQQCHQKSQQYISLISFAACTFTTYTVLVFSFELSATATEKSSRKHSPPLSIRTLSIFLFSMGPQGHYKQDISALEKVQRLRAQCITETLLLSISCYWHVRTRSLCQEVVVLDEKKSFKITVFDQMRNSYRESVTSVLHDLEWPPLQHGRRIIIKRLTTFYKAVNNSVPVTIKIVSEYDQEIPQSQTADNPVAPRGRAAQPSQDSRKTN